MDFQKIKNSITELVGENASSETLQKLGQVTGLIDEAEKEHKSLVDDANNIRKMYVDAVKNMGTSDKPKEVNEPAKEKSLLDYLLDEQKKSNK